MPKFRLILAWSQRNPRARNLGEKCDASHGGKAHAGAESFRIIETKAAICSLYVKNNGAGDSAGVAVFGPGQLPCGPASA